MTVNVKAKYCAQCGHRLHPDKRQWRHSMRGRRLDICRSCANAEGRQATVPSNNQ